MQIPTERSLLLPPLGEVAPEIIHSNRSSVDEGFYRRREEEEESEEEDGGNDNEIDALNVGSNTHHNTNDSNNRDGCPHEAVQCPVCKHSFCINIIEVRPHACIVFVSVLFHLLVVLLFAFSSLQYVSFRNTQTSALNNLNGVECGGISCNNNEMKGKGEWKNLSG